MRWISIANFCALASIDGKVVWQHHDGIFFGSVNRFQSNDKTFFFSHVHRSLSGAAFVSFTPQRTRIHSTLFRLRNSWHFSFDKKKSRSLSRHGRSMPSLDWIFFGDFCLSPMKKGSMTNWFSHWIHFGQTISTHFLLSTLVRSSRISICFLFYMISHVAKRKIKLFYLFDGGRNDPKMFNIWFRISRISIISCSIYVLFSHLISSFIYFCECSQIFFRHRHEDSVVGFLFRFQFICDAKW